MVKWERQGTVLNFYKFLISFSFNLQQWCGKIIALTLSWF